MIRLKPVRNMCVVDSDIWFIARGINALIRYSDETHDVEYIPVLGNIEEDFSYLATYCFNNTIYLPPVYEQGFGAYNLIDKSFRQIITPNSQAKHNFGFSFLEGNTIISIPDKISGPFVFFDMKNERENRKPVFFPKKYINDNAIPMFAQKISENLYYGLLYPQNTIYVLDTVSGKFNFYRNEIIEGTIESFYVKNGYIYIFTPGMLYLTDLYMNIIQKKAIDIYEKMYFIGDLAGFIFADIVNNPVKKMFKYENESLIYRDFDEMGFGWIAGSTSPGIIHNDPENNRSLYFSSGCCGIFEWIGEECCFYEIKFTNEAEHRIINEFIKESYSGKIVKENTVFRIENFVKGISCYG